MKRRFPGSCPCGEVDLEILLPRALEDYRPRACDCDFCTRHRIWYLSDPAGAIRIRAGHELGAHRQGSGQARFLACADCGSVVAVVCFFEPGLKGAVNARLLEERNSLAEPEAVSCGLLSAQDKRDRWLNIWSAVTLKAPGVADL